MPARSGHGPIPPMLGRYRILRRLGSGGMAEVFLARSTGAEGIEKTLVLKRVLPTVAKSARFISMFVDEAKLAMRLNHPNVVQVYAFEQVRGELVLAMELVDGIDLARLLAAARRAKRRLPATLAAYIVAETAKGLHYAHERKDERGQPMEIVHRDVSPQNVLVSYDGSVKVADFGIARARSFSDRDGSIKGKFAYMAPEQARGEPVDRRTDVYALGALLTELCAGEPPLGRRAGPEVLPSIREGRVSTPRELDSTVPEELHGVAVRALSLDPADRFESAREFGRALTGYLHAQPDLIDATVLEAWLSQTAPRPAPSAEASPDREPADPWFNEARTTTYSPGGGDLRERRPVVVVCGELAGGADDMLPSWHRQATRILDDIAYKDDAVLSWRGPEDERRGFQFLLGLGDVRRSEPLRAIRLALDVVDALGALDGGTAFLTGGLGVSRGVLATVRDPSGLLLRYQPEDSVFALADTLAGAGKSGEVLTTGEVFRLARRDFAFDEGEVRDVAVSLGEDVTPQGVRAYSVRGVRQGAQRRSVLHRPAVAPRLVGRDKPLRRLADAYAQVLDTAMPQTLVLVGDLGVGKTALARAALAELSPSPRALWLECGFGGNREPLSTAWALLHMLCEVDRHAQPDELVARVRELLADQPEAASHGERLARLFDAPADEHAAGTLADVLLALLSSRSRGMPVVLCVDALQWADDLSLSVLAAIGAAEQTQGRFCLWLITRPGPWAQALGGLVQLSLQELSEDDRRALVRTCFGGALVPEEVQRTILARAGGNPFFIVELADALLERGVLAVVSDASSGSSPPGVQGGQLRVSRRRAAEVALPATVEDVVTSRLAQLTGDGLAALRWLALCGGGLSAGSLSEVAEMPLSDALRDLQTRQLLRRDAAGGYIFSNAVVRQVALDGIDLHDRARMQQSVDGYMRRLRPYLAWVAKARDLEGSGQSKEAAEHFVRAGEEARAHRRPEDALRYQAHALALMDRADPARLTPHLERARILRSLGRTRLWREELDALRDLGERTGQARLRTWAHAELARWSLDHGDLQGARAALDRARALWQQSHDVAFAPHMLALQAWLCQASGDAQGGLSTCALALEQPSAEVDAPGLAEAQLVQAHLLLQVGDTDASEQAAARALCSAQRAQAPELQVRALSSLARSRTALGGYDDGVALWRSALALARSLSAPTRSATRLSELGLLYAARGEAVPAQEFLQRACRAADALGEWRAWTRATSESIELFAEAGDFDHAERGMAQLTGASAARADGWQTALERVGRAGLALRAGDAAHAEQCAEEALSRIGPSPSPDIRLLALSRRAQALSQLDRPAQAREVAREAATTLLSTSMDRRVERAYAGVLAALQDAQLSDLLGRCRQRALDWVQRCGQGLTQPGARAQYEASPSVAQILGAR